MSSPRRRAATDARRSGYRSPGYDGSRKCDYCSRPATIFLTTVFVSEHQDGEKVTQNLCEGCAAENEGLPAKDHLPIDELLKCLAARETETKPNDELT